MLRDERAIYPIWEQLVSSLAVKGKQAHDARLAAAMRRHGVGHLLTFNAADFARYPFVTPLVPAKLDSAFFAAYQWRADLTDEQILERLLALNLERATIQRNGDD